MANLHLNVRPDVGEWIESRVRKGEFASSDEYLSALVERDRDSRSDEERIDELRRIVQEAEASGVSNRTASERIAEGDRRVRGRDLG